MSRTISHIATVTRHSQTLRTVIPEPVAKKLKRSQCTKAIVIGFWIFEAMLTMIALMVSQFLNFPPTQTNNLTTIGN